MFPPLPASSPVPTPPSRLRRLTATFALAVACIGTVATSGPISPDIFAEQTGPAIVLTAETPKSQRHFLIQVSARDADNLISANLETQMTATWKPADPSATEGPTLLAQVALADEIYNDPVGNRLVFDTPGVTRSVHSNGVIFPVCNLDGKCEWDVVMNLELTGNIGPGSVVVDWKLNARASAYDTEDLPEDFTLQIVEP